MPQDTPSRKLDQYIVRFPDGMRDQLKDEAENNGRSMNAEIIQRLSQSLEAEAGGNARLILDMPEETMKELSLSSFVYDQSIEEYVLSLVRRDVERLAEYQSASEEIFELQGQLAQKENELSFLRSLSDSDFSAFYSATMLQWTLTQTVLRHASKLPPDIVDEVERRKLAAERMMKSAELRTADFRGRHSPDVQQGYGTDLHSKIQELLRQAAEELGVDKLDKNSAA